MKRLLFSIGLFMLAGLILIGCEFESLVQDDTLLKVEEALLEETQNQGLFDLQELGGLGNFIEANRTAMIGTYQVTFLNRVENLNNTTTFFYNVKGTGQTPALDSFFLEIPGCSGNPVARTPSNASSIDGGFIKWNSSIPVNSEQNYSVTYPGIVSLGLIDAIVVSGNVSNTGKVLGPCKGIYKIEGSIFIDSVNDDNIRQPTESGLGGFIIELIDNINNVTVKTTTDDLGFFSFSVLESNYTIKVVDNLVSQNYKARNDRTSYEIGIVNENKTCALFTGFCPLNFGYFLDRAKFIKDIEDGIVILDTKDSKFWTQELRAQGRGGNREYTKADLERYLKAIDQLYFVRPYIVGEDNFKTALDIITRPIKGELDLFLQQLITAELNIVSGRGGTKEYNDALVRFARPIACAQLPNCSSSSAQGRVSTTNELINALTSSDTQVLSSFNGSGGIKR